MSNFCSRREHRGRWARGTGGWAEAIRGTHVRGPAATRFPGSRPSDHTDGVRLGALPSGGVHGDRLAVLLVGFVVAGLLATTCGPTTSGQQHAAGAELTAEDLADLAPEASDEVRQRALQLSDGDGNGIIDPDELDAFFAALARAERESALAQTSTTVPAFVEPGEVMPAVDTDDPRLFVVGDSVLEASYPTLGSMLPSWELVPDTRVGRRVPEGAEVIEERGRDIGDVAVVVLGHNYSRGEGFEGQFNRIMRQLWRLDRVVWVTVAEWDTGQPEVNATIRSAPETWPNVVVADWAALAAANPGYLQGDRVHLTSTGVLALADLMARAVGPGPIPGVPGIVQVDVPLGPGSPSVDDSTGVPATPTSSVGSTPSGPPRTTTTRPPAPITTVTTRPVSTTTPPSVVTTMPSPTTEVPATTEAPPTTVLLD